MCASAILVDISGFTTPNSGETRNECTGSVDRLPEKTLWRRLATRIITRRHKWMHYEGTDCPYLASNTSGSKQFFHRSVTARLKELTVLSKVS